MQVELRELSKTYDGNHWAVRDVCLQIPAGAVFGLIGPNGAGKSTALRMVAAVMEPTAGEVMYDGVVPSTPHARQEVRRRIGFLGDGNPLYRQMTAREYLRFFGQCFRMSPVELERAIDEVLATLQLEVKADATCGTLSKGMRQRLLVGRCLIHRPALLILDEPADGLDPRGRSDLRRLLLDVRARGTTVVVSSHILRELDDLCDRVAILQRGEVAVCGPVSEIIDRYEVGRFVYQLRVLEGADRAAEVLARHRVLVESTGEVDGLPALAIQMHGGEALLAEIVRDLVASGVPVVTCSRLRSRLEDVYNRLSDDLVS